MTSRADRQYPISLPVRWASVVDSPAAGGAVRLSEAGLVLDRTSLRLEARSRHGRRRWRIPYERITDSGTRGNTGLFLRIRSGESIFLEVEGWQDWVHVRS